MLDVNFKLSSIIDDVGNSFGGHVDAHNRDDVLLSYDNCSRLFLKINFQFKFLVIQIFENQLIDQ